MYSRTKTYKTVTDAVDEHDTQEIPEFASVSEEAKESYMAEHVDADVAMETARAILESSAYALASASADASASASADFDHTEGVEESKDAPTVEYHYELTEEEKMMEALRNGEVYVPDSDEYDGNELKKLAQSMQKLSEEIGKKPDTADDSIVIPDVGTEELETDSDTESVTMDVDLDTDLGTQTQTQTQTQTVVDTATTADTVDTTDTVDFVAESRDYKRDLDRLSDETLPVPARIRALEHLKLSDTQESGETQEFTEWLLNFYRGVDISSNRELVLQLIRLSPEWLTMDELMILCSFIYSGTRARVDNLAEWKTLAEMYNRYRGKLANLPAMHHITITEWFINHPKLFQQGKICFTDLLLRDDVPPENVYRVILRSKTTDSRREQLHKTHFVHQNVPIRYKILSAQNLSPSETNKYLTGIMTDASVEVRVRADIVDLFINHGDPHQKEQAIQVLEELGADAYNVYNNRENVHNTRITESALAIIDSLYDRCVEDTPPELFEETLASDSTIDQLRKKWEDHSEYSVFKLALLRIELDRQKYGSHGLTLVQILNLVLTFINQEFSEDHELHTRVFQELVDSAIEGETCSSGHAFRLVNALSGYTEYSIQVSFDDQLSAYFQREFQRLLMESEHMDMLSEMADDMDSFLHKPETMSFIRENLHTIRQTLWSEFQDDLDDLDFDETFQRVAVRYGVVV